MNRYLTPALMLAHAFVLATTSLVKAEVVCSYSNGMPTICCDSDVEYCGGFPIYGRQVWEDVQGRWKGTIRFHTTSCAYKNRPQAEFIDVRIKSLAEYNPDYEEANVLSGRTPNRRYSGYFQPPAGIDDPVTYLFARAKHRTSSGHNCTLRFSLVMNYTGGRTSKVTAFKELSCPGFRPCQTVRKGTLRRTTKVARR